jgi:hypothetical protein
MRKRIVLFLCSFVLVSGSFAQKLSDQQVIQMAVQEKKAGASETEIATRLMQKGATMDQIQRIPHRAGGRIRSEIPRVIALCAVRELHPGEILLHRHADVRVGLVVLEHRVVARGVLLDEVALEHKSFHLRRRNDIFEVGYKAYHFSNLKRTVMTVTFSEILPYTIMKIHSLSDVEDFLG